MKCIWFSQVLCEFRDALLNGQAPSVEDYLQRYPEHTERLQKVLPAVAAALNGDMTEKQIQTLKARVLPRLLAHMDRLLQEKH